LYVSSKKERSIAVHLSSGLTYVFYEGEGGLYYFDTGSPDNHSKNTSAHYSFISFLSTVASNKLPFTKAQIRGADAARALQSILALPSIKDFKHLVASNAIKTLQSPSMILTEPSISTVQHCQLFKAK